MIVFSWFNPPQSLRQEYTDSSRWPCLYSTMHFEYHQSIIEACPSYRVSKAPMYFIIANVIAQTTDRRTGVDNQSMTQILYTNEIHGTAIGWTGETSQTLTLLTFNHRYLPATETHPRVEITWHLCIQIADLKYDGSMKKKMKRSLLESIQVKQNVERFLSVDVFWTDCELVALDNFIFERKRIKQLCWYLFSLRSGNAKP